MSASPISNILRWSTSRDGAYVNLPTPSSDGLSYEIETLVDSDRNAQGLMIGNTIGEDKIKLSVTYPPMSNDTLHYLLTLLDKDHAGSFTGYLEFFDPRVNQRVVKHMYIGNRSFDPSMVPLSRGTGEPTYWLNVKCNFIEV